MAIHSNQLVVRISDVEDPSVSYETLAMVTGETCRVIDEDNDVYYGFLYQIIQRKYLRVVEGRVYVYVGDVDEDSYDNPWDVSGIFGNHIVVDYDGDFGIVIETSADHGVYALEDSGSAVDAQHPYVAIGNSYKQYLAFFDGELVYDTGWYYCQSEDLFSREKRGSVECCNRTGLFDRDGRFVVDDEREAKCLPILETKKDELDWLEDMTKEVE